MTVQDPQEVGRTSDPLNRVLAALAETTGHHLKRCGSGWQARCPAHDDRSPSLSVGVGSNGDGRVVIHCHAGCEADAVVAALNLTVADLFPHREKPTRPQAVARYQYCDERGELLFTVERYEPGVNGKRKSFRQVPASGRRGTGAMEGVRRVPYQLPDLLAAIEAGRPVYFVEGEKDADRLRREGQVATTTVMGAGKWDDHYAAHFAGAAQVLVVADNDQPGRVHAAQVARSLTGAGVLVTCLLPAAGKDVSDHLDAGHTLDELRRLNVDELAEVQGDETEGGGQDDGGTQPGARTICLANVTPERITWVWAGRLPAGKVVLLDGDPGVGKSTFTLDLAARITTGSPMPDGQPCLRPGVVLILSAEDGLADTIRPRLDAVGADPTRVHVLTEVVGADGRPRPVDLAADLVEIRRLVDDLAVVLVVVDPLMAYLGSGVDSHRDQDVRRVLAPLAKIADETGTAFLVVRHLNKSGGANALYRGGGSIGIVGAARMGYLVAKDPDDDGRRILAGTKCNIATMPSSLAYRLIADERHGCACLSWEGAVEVQADDLLRPVEAPDERSERDEATDWLTDYLTVQGRSRSADVKKAARAAGISERTLKRVLRSLSVDVEQDGFPRTTYWSLPQSGQLGHQQPQWGQLGQGSEGWPDWPDWAHRGPTGPTGLTDGSPTITTAEPGGNAQSPDGERLTIDGEPSGGGNDLPDDWIQTPYETACEVCGELATTADPRQRIRHPSCEPAA